MPVDNSIILYGLANAFHQTLGVAICDNTKTYIKSKAKKFHKLISEEKIYYTKYCVQITQSLINYLGKISFFELNIDSDHNIIHDFRLTWGKNDNMVHISLSHTTINTNDVIPEKLMKICGYKKNTNVCKAYTKSYTKINDKGYGKIQSQNKYSELSDKNKNKALLDPTRTLVLTTLSKKRKCSTHLYYHLFGEIDRIVFRLYKNRFAFYDFGKELDAVESFKMKLDPDRNIIITFNNNASFSLSLHTNATEIKPHLSLKFKTTFKNMDELFMVEKFSI